MSKLRVKPKLYKYAVEVKLLLDGRLMDAPVFEGIEAPDITVARQYALDMADGYLDELVGEDTAKRKRYRVQLGYVEGEVTVDDILPPAKSTAVVPLPFKPVIPKPRFVCPVSELCTVSVELKDPYLNISLD